MSAETRPVVAVLFGGRSLEHDVSVVSGLQILHAIDPARFHPIPVYVDQRARWWVGEALWKKEFFKRGRFDTRVVSEVSLSREFGTSLLLFAEGSGSRATGQNARSIAVDVFVPVLHGSYGEDGCIQGELDAGGCAYAGSGVLASAVGMNKRLTKVVAAHAGVPVLPWVSCQRAVLSKGTKWLHDLPTQVENSFGFPVIVKPCNLGSSAGVSVARSAEELGAGVLNVFEYDTEALIEPFIQKRLELNVAVAGLQEPTASVSEMPVTQAASPLSFAEKYKKQGGKMVGSSEGMATALRVLDPEDLPSEMRRRAQEYATTVFAELGCEGIARIDFLIDTDRCELFFNEINTVPGSLAFYLWSAAPHYWTITELLTRLIERAASIRAAKISLRRDPPPELRLLG